MTDQAGTLVWSGESLRRAIIHLRLRFSLVLTPLFFWGVYLATAGALPWGRIALAYLVVHLPLYGGMNAYNTFYDRDEGPIGALLDPPPVDYTVLVVALLCKALALLAGLLIAPWFGLLVGAAIVLSLLYSHARTRWKERPLLAALSIFVGQGIFGVLWGWGAVRWHMPSQAQWPADWLGVLGVCSAALWTLGLYPLSGVYQIETDRARGIRTLAVTLGTRGSFLFGAACAAVGALGVLLVLGMRGAWIGFGLNLVCIAWTGAYTLGWYGRFQRLSVRENQRALMRLAYANAACFTTLFVGLAAAAARH